MPTDASRRCWPLLLLFGAAACGGDKDTTSPPVHTDSVADVDTDTDADADTDSDADSDTDADTDPPFTMLSADFISSAGDPLAAECPWIMPAVFSCTSPNPELTWVGVPAGATSLLLLFDDPDAGDFPHWGIYNIPAAETGLARGVSGQGAPGSPPPGSDELDNGGGFNGYYGPCPPSPHVYRWRLFALSQELPVAPSGSPSQQFDAAEAFAVANSVGGATLCNIFNP